MDRKPDIVCISSIDWDFIWQGHQEIMSTLAAAGAPRAVPREHRRPRAADARPAARAPADSATGGAAPRASARSGRTCSSTRRWSLPLAVLAAGALDQPLRADARAQALDAGHRLLPADRLDVPADAAGLRSAFASINPQLTIYYCIDDFASSSAGAKRIVASEERLFRDADLVFVTSERLRAARGARSASACTCFRSASASSGSTRSARSRRRSPEDLQRLPRPVDRLRRRPAPVDRSGAGRPRSHDSCRRRRSRWSGRSRPTSRRCEREPNIRLLGHARAPRAAALRQGVRRRHRARTG